MAAGSFEYLTILLEGAFVTKTAHHKSPLGNSPQVHT